MLYLDASLVTALVTDEDRSPQVQRWFDEQDPGELVLSPWCLTEVASALSVKQRTGDLIAADRALADRLVDAISSSGVGSTNVLAADFEAAARMCGRAELTLRAGDALHLAVVNRLGATLHSLDEAQVAAARELGIDAVITVERE